MPPRAISIMYLVQVLLLSLAWLLTARFVKTAEVSWETVGVGIINDIPFFRWLKSYTGWGLLLLLVPLAAAIVCTRLSCAHREQALVGPGGFRLCLVITLITTTFAVFVVWNAFKFAFSPPIVTLLGT